MDLKMKIENYMNPVSTKLALLSTTLYWVFENNQALMGAIVTFGVGVSTVAYQWYRVIEIRNAERRREELHQQQLRKNEQAD